MSTTSTITPGNSGKLSDNKKKAAAFAATAAAAAGAGAAGAQFASELNNNEDIEPVAEVIETQPEASANTTQHTTSGANTTSSANTTTTEPVQEAVTETTETTTETTETTSEATQTTSEATQTTSETTQTTSETTQTTSETTSETTQTTSDEVVNPDDVAEAIIAEDLIDANDIDMDDVINFDEISTVYTVDGESYTAATFHDVAGNDLIMLDVDGDNVFDVITDYDGNLIAEVPGNLSIGDAQEDIVDDNEYLAYDSDLDNVDEYGADSLADDLMA